MRICVTRPWVPLLILICSARSTPLLAQAVTETTAQKLAAMNATERAAAVAEKQLLHLTVRFESRITNSFRCEKLDLIFRHPGTIRLPDRMLRGQRIDIIGQLQKEANRFSFRILRMQSSDTDVELIRQQIRDLRGESPEEMLQLASRFAAEAEYYEDDALRDEIISVRTEAVRLIRKSSPDNPDALKQLINRGATLGVSSDLMTQLEYEWLAASLKQDSPNLAILQFAARQLSGWDTPSTPSQQMQQQFEKNPAEVWQNSDQKSRSKLHRLLYVRIRSELLRKELQKDGSNGLRIAATAAQELPEMTQLAVDFQNAAIGWFETDLERRERKELIEFSEELNAAERTSAAIQIRERWLRKQEARFGTSSLAGLVRTAEEHLFVAEQWQDETALNRGVLMLKNAWDTAASESPEDASAIAERLKLLGWERFRDRWMTRQEMSSIPQNDLQLAARQGRVVAGMKRDQVLLILGNPTGIARVGSASSIREFWSYPEASLTIVMKRSTTEQAEQMTVTGVTRSVP